MMIPNTNEVNEADLIFAMGVRFWSNLVISDNIKNVEKCSEVLQTLNLVIESKQTYETFSSFEEEGFEENDLKLTIQDNEAEDFIDPVDEEFSSVFIEANDSSELEELENESGRAEEINKNHKCEFCDFQNNQFVVLKKHIRDNHKTDYSNFLVQNNVFYKNSCEYCKEPFTSISQLKNHIFKNHEDKFPAFEQKYMVVECKHCNKRLLSKAILRHHERKVHKIFKTEMLPNGKYKSEKPKSISTIDNLPFKSLRKCEECNKTFKDFHGFSDHLKLHDLGRKPYQCEQCAKAFSHRRQYTMHIKDHSVVGEVILCDDCGESFHTNHEMKEHSKNTHRLKTIMKKKHKIELNEESEFVCDTCGDIFGKKSSYKYHLESRHRGEDQICEICSFKTTNKILMGRHRDTHLAPSVPCDECGKLFKGSFHLYRHKRNVHMDSKDRPFQCEECGKGFAVRQAYEGHTNMHKGIKPYHCSYCEGKFQNQSNKLNHVKKVHPEKIYN